MFDLYSSSKYTSSKTVLLFCFHFAYCSVVLLQRSKVLVPRCLAFMLSYNVMLIINPTFLYSILMIEVFTHKGTKLIWRTKIIKCSYQWSKCVWLMNKFQVQKSREKFLVNSCKFVFLERLRIFCLSELGIWRVRICVNSCNLSTVYCNCTLFSRCKI